MKDAHEVVKIGSSKFWTVPCPYLVEIFDKADKVDCREIVVMKGVAIGFTEILELPKGRVVVYFK